MFEFPDVKQAATVMVDLWSNQASDISGLLLKTEEFPYSLKFSYAIEINYTDAGHISDDDANDYDYDELIHSKKRNKYLP